MKTNLLTIAILFTSLFSTYQANAQKPKTGCNDVGIKSQADGVKTGLQKQGMKLFQEAMITMESMEPAPVVVKLIGGQNYEFIFIGNSDASRMMMEVFDGKDKKIDEKIVKGGSNQIVYSFTAPKTDAYLFTMMQKKSGRDKTCGYFGVMAYETGIKTTRPAPQPSPVTKTPAKPNNTNTTTTVTRPANTQNSTWQTTPANPQQRPKPDYEQKPNPNRTKASQEYMNQGKQGQQ